MWAFVDLIPCLTPPRSPGTQVMLAEGKASKQLYAVKMIKKNYTIAQDEVERYV